MTERIHHQQTMFDRLRRSRTAKIALLSAGLALTGCAASNSSPGKTSKTPVTAVGTRTPGTTAPSTATSAPSTGQTAPATGQTTRADWCSATSTIIAEAFVDPNAGSECEVMPASATPGDVLIKYTLNTAGASGYSVELSVINSPFDQFTAAAKPKSGGGTRYVELPNGETMYVAVPGDPSVTGELELLTGSGGTDPLGFQNMVPQAAGAFAVFGSTPIAQLYPASAAQS